jgi:hypothetical protein
MKYLINLVEQEDQPIMRVMRPMLWFTSFRALQRMWAGIAVMDQIPQITRERLVVQHSHCICNPTIPKASPMRCVTPNLYILRPRGDRIQFCAIISSKSRPLYWVCFSDIHLGYHQHKGVRINCSMKVMVLATVCVNLNAYIGPVELVFIDN